MTREEAAAAGHCLLFIDSETGKPCRYHCHETTILYGFEEVEQPTGKYVYNCSTCSENLGQPVRYCYEDGQVYVWNP